MVQHIHVFALQNVLTFYEEKRLLEVKSHVMITGVATSVSLKLKPRFSPGFHMSSDLRYGLTFRFVGNSYSMC